MRDWLVPVIVALIGGTFGGGMLPLVQAFRGRGRERADTVAVLSDEARKWTTEFRTEAMNARHEAAALRAEMHIARREATALADDLHRLRVAIMSPEATIEGLRELVRLGSGGSNL